VRGIALAFVLSLAAHGQDPAAEKIAARAPELRKLLESSPRLPVERIPLSERMANAASLGIVSSVAADRNGVVYALQRGDKADPVIAVDREGRVLRSWGKGMYTVPHSIRVDPDGNIWTVDAGSSMLLKFSPEGKKLQEISVGEIATGDKCYVPTLCGTTDVAFGANGRMYISDGYGNARILEYTADGKRVKAWGSSGTGPGQFQVPHGIARNGNTLYVADRTNARIQRFNLDGGYLGEWTHLGRPYALKIENGALWAAIMTLEPAGQGNAKAASGLRATPWMLKIDPETGKLLGQVESTGPHAIDVSRDEDLFATGCCGGISPPTFSLFRRTR
jgi:hypothetical protein